MDCNAGPIATGVDTRKGMCESMFRDAAKQRWRHAPGGPIGTAALRPRAARVDDPGISL
jgi:hypothetical protein